MSIKTNELQKITSLWGTDTILVDTDEKGTGPRPGPLFAVCPFLSQ